MDGKEMQDHYGKNGHCCAPLRTVEDLICTAKVLPCVDARQRPPGKDSDGNGNIVVDHLHGNVLCRARTGLPCGRRFAVHAAFVVQLVGSLPS
jgi:hypothetical protein